MRRTVSEVLAIGLAALAFGCGVRGRHSSPKATFETAWRAAKTGDRAGLRECFDKASQAELDEIERVRADVGEAPNLPKSFLDVLIAEAQRGTHAVDREVVEGDRATLNVTISGRDQALQLVNERGAWKFDASADLARLRRMLEGVRALRKAFDGPKRPR